MPEKPLVSVIALCYNHENYLLECLDAVMRQSYPFLELIIIDDGSTDRSAELIETFCQKHEKVQFLKLTENIGNCRAFNKGLALAKGKYVMDLATDDVLETDCIENQVNRFEELPENYGVVFGNAQLIDEKGNFLHYFYPTDYLGKVQKPVPQGDIYAAILAHSFICTPTTLFRKKMLEDLGGYDETLSYEDFDIWVRSSRTWHYAFLDKVLLSKRVLSNSLGAKFYQKKQNPHLLSTLKICEKAFFQNRNEQENKALAQRLRYHVRLSTYTENFETAFLFFELLKKVDKISFLDKIWKFLILRKVPLNRLYSWYRNCKKENNLAKFFRFHKAIFFI